MKIEVFLEKIKAYNLYLELNENDLTLKGKNGFFEEEQINQIRKDNEIINFLKENKERLINYLNSNNSNLNHYQSQKVCSIYKLTPLQEGIMFHTLYEKKSKNYVAQFQCNVSNLDISVFRSTWSYLLKKYTVFRTGFRWKSMKEPIQYVYDFLPVPLTILDYSDFPKKSIYGEIESFLKDDLNKGFELEKPPLMRITLIKLPFTGVYKLVWTNHHLIMDGWSRTILMGDFLSTYELLSQGAVLPDIDEDKYEDYIGYIDNVNRYKSELHWGDYLSNFSGAILLPFVAQVLDRNKGIGIYKKSALLFDDVYTTLIKDYCQSESLTVNSLVQGIWGYLLSRYTGLSDVLYGVTVSGRPDDLKDMETRVGLYINTLPLRVRVQEGQNISSWLQDLQQGHAQGREYQYVPLSDLQKITGVIGDLFDSLLVFENYPMDKFMETAFQSDGLKFLELDGDDAVKEEQTNYLLTLIIELDQELSINFNYNSDILSSAYVSMIKGHFKEVMDQIINSSVDSTLGDLDMLTNEERHELLEVFNDTAVEYPRDKSVVDLFEEQVLQSPDSIALVYEDSILSYGELNSRSNQLGHYLQDKGVKENSLVGICLDRSLDMVIGILGILKSGGGYVPIDPEYPQDRLNYIVDDTELLTLLTSSDYMFNFPSYTGDLLILDFQEEEIAKYKDTNSSIAISSDSLAYIIYTSGSTGIPKGVMVPHAGLQNYLFSSDGLYTITSKEFQGGSYATFSLSFDASITSLFLPLLGGVSLVLSSGVGVSLFEDFNLLSYAPYSFLKLTPSHLSILSSFLDKYSLPFSYLSNVYVFGGESLESHHLSYFDSSNSIYIYNEYGPTESTVGSIVHQIDLSKISKFFSKGSIIGTPISNTQVYVLDSDGSIQPIGVIGELYVGGLGLSRGYLNRLELTTDKFLSNPFKEGDRLYKTGDLCRWSLDGYLEFIGRIDDQVKIRGYRIELGEIESVLVELPDVKQGVVLAREDEKGVKRLVGYLVFDGNSDHASVEDQLAQKLPSYMIPTLWLELEELPLTSNGKVDKKGLPNIGLGSLESNEYVAPRSSIEEVLVAIWQDVLGLNRIGVTDNFFKTGGDSLLAIRVVSMISKELELEISVRDLFEYPMISELSTHLGTLSPGLLVPRLKPQDRPAHIHLSFAQERLWFIDKLEGSVQYHQPVILRLQGRLDKDILESSFIGLVSRHEILRTVIKEEDGVGYQYIEEEASWSMDYIEDYGFTSEENLQLYLDELINIPYVLSEESILRVHLIRLSGEEHILLVMTHHIGSDGWSVSVMIDEFVELYNAFEAGREISLAALPIQYADYSLWQRDYLSGELLEDKLKYWEDILGGVAPLELSTDYVRPAIQSTQGASRGIELEGSLLSDLQVLCRDHDVTMFMLLLSVFKVLLYRYSGQVDICVGSPIAGRTQKELEGLIGFFINTLALRSRFNGDRVFTDLLEEVKQTTLGAYEHQDVPFEKIVDHLGVERDMSRSPLFQVMFVLQNTPESKEGLSMGDITIAEEGSSRTTSLFDLTLSVTEHSEGLSIGVEYCTALFMESTIAGMLIHYKELLLSVIQAPGVRVGDLDMLTNEERHEMLEVFNDTAVEYPRDKSVVDLFEEQVLQSPDSIALVYEDSILSYQELNKRSNQLGHYLIEEGVREHSLVGICLDRSLDMVIGILGILKSGGGYVPMDPSYPEDRISYMLEDTGVSLVLSSGLVVERLKFQKELLIVDLGSFEYTFYSDLDIALSISSDSLAYIIYTSGSTGIPKGVLIGHFNVVNTLLSQIQLFSVNNLSNCLQYANQCFDASVSEIFVSLLSGAKLFIIEESLKSDIDYFTHYISRSFISVTTLPPSFFSLLDYKCLEIETLITAGEEAPLDQVRSFSKEGGRYINAYGPTESSICTTTFQGTIINSIPIGTPISNTQVYVLDSDGSIQPIGVIGELYVGGLGLSRGYLNRVELTTEKFIASPFKQGDRLYKTGDLCRWNREGNLEFMGRIDDQVKIRGYRIELGEIESVLQELPDVNQGVVLARDDDKGVKRLVGYVVVEGDFDKANLKSQLGDRLPNYMVPEIWVELEKLPLTSNGKVDRKGLPSVDLNNLSSKAYVAPRNEIEENLVAIWSSVLGLERVGIHDNFFELGGDSIITIQVVSRAKRLGYELRPRDLFTYPSIASLSDRVTRESSILGDQGILEGSSGLLPIQQWYFDHSPKDISHYNQSVLLGISKDLLVSDLSQVVEGLVSHHDALRFVYNHVDGSWNQHYGFAAGVLEVEDLCLVSSEDLWDSIEDVCNSYQVSLDIESGIVCRFVLIKTPDFDSHHRLFIVIHHLVVDGVSWRILLDDLELGFSQVVSGGSIDFGFKSSSYREWYDTLHTYSLGKSFMSQLGYWRRVLTSYEELPVDYEDSGVEGLGFSDFSISLSESMTYDLLHNVHGAYHTEINDILLSALVLMIKEWTGLSSVVIGLEGHGREDISETIDLSRTVGWFTVLYPVLFSVSQELSLDLVIKSVKEDLRGVPDKGLGYGVLRYLDSSGGIGQDMSSLDSIDLIFNYLGQLDHVLDSGGILTGASESSGLDSSLSNGIENKLAFNGSVTGGVLEFTISYSRDQYAPATIDRLGASYIGHLESIIVHCKSKEISEKTPSDYVGFKGDLSYSSLDSFLSQEVSGGVKQGTLIDSLYGLSPLQSGLLFHGLYGDDSLSYIEQLQVSFYALDVGIFKQSWDYLLKKYSILRTGFHYKDLEEPLQSVYKEVDLPFAELDYRDMSKSERDSVLALFKAEDLKRGFDLAEAPLMRISLMRISNSEHILLWTSHHLILDGWSSSILMGDFLSTYELLSQGVVLPDIAEDKYEDYIGYIDNVNKYKSESHWENYLSNFSGSSLLPFVAQDLYRNKGEGVYGEEHLVFDSATTTEVQGYCQSNSLTVNSLVQGIWGYLLSRYTGLSDVLYGVTVSGRPDDLKDMETRVGLYINTLPLCVRIKEGQNISSWLQDLQQGHTQGREYQYVPLSDLQKITGVIGDLFDSLLVFENYPVSEVLERGPEGESDSWALSGGDVEMQEQTNYLLTLIVGLDQELSIKFNYNSDILSSAYVSMIKGHFKEVMDQIINSSVDSTLGDLDMLTNEERHELLEVFNDTAVEYPRDKSVVDLFEEQVLQSPDSIALVYEDSILSYGELNSRSNQLGHYLQDKGVKENSLVGICLDRSLDMVIGILGILKSGGGYVPIDPEYPQDRLNYIVDDTELLTLLTSSDYMFNFPSYTGDLLILDFQEEEIAKYKDTNSSIAISSDSLAYIIYTSGSTGIPKGVMVPHAGLQNYLFSSDGLYTITSKEFQGGSYATFSLSFDASITSLFLPLLGGVSLVLSSGVGVSLFEDFNLLSYAPYSFLKLTPSHLSILSSFLDKYSLPFSYLSNVYVFGGESLESHHLSYFDSSNSIYIYNEYGPTESTVGSIVHQIDLSKISKFFSKGSIIGTPISNTQVYVLDSDGSIQPIGVIGELYVGGLGLSRGYLNRLELTTDKFLSNPFKEGDRLYKTGDLCRWSLDGYLEFIGRIDDQVKIRGYRIELGEIESVLVELPDVKQGVVLAREDEKGVKRLVGYLVFDGNSDHASVEDQLAQKLPSYMIPTLWLELEELPLTSNGKVDKKGLPNIGLGSLESNEYVAPRSSIEEVLVAIWQDVLGLNRIGVTDNFFKTGGDSLLAIRVVSMISKELELEISVRDLFEYPMISELSTHLGTLSPGLLVPRLKPQDRPAHIHLSFAQERLWFIDKLEGSVQYHQPVILRLQGRLDKDILESSFIGLVSRHEILRTVIKEEDGVGYQYIEEEASWSMDYIGNYEFTGEEHLQLYLDELISIPYELSEESILRVHLIRLSGEEHILLVMTHHIGSDGWSVSVMIDEFVELYNAFEAGREISLAALPIQYADYSLWQRDYLSGELLEDKLKYWEDTLGGVAPLELSTDYVRPAIQSTQGASRGIELEGSLLSDLQVLCRDHDVTMFMLLLSVFKVLLYRYSGQVDICVGSPIAGRTQKELEGLIGFFINTLALRSRFNGDIVFTDLLEEVKQTTLGAYEHQDVPFEKIVDHLGVERDMSRSALFQVMFVLQNTPESKDGLSMGDLVIYEEGSSRTTSLFDLTLSVTEHSEGLSIGVEYCTALFMESTIAGMLIHYKELLLSVIQAPEVRVGDLDMLTNEERHELLEVFNDTEVEYPRDKSIVDLFEEQVLQSPDSIALVYEDSILTYQELNKRSNQLGHYLREEGVRANSLVGICLDRGLDMVIGILGILKSGGGYVPMDPSYPEDRISYILEDTGVSLVLSSGLVVERLKFQKELLIIDLASFEYTFYSDLDIALSISSDSLAYIIYTSGSTGLPKGSMNDHSGIFNRLQWAQDTFGLTVIDVVLQKTTFCFDVSVWELLWPLLFGSRLVFAKPGGEKDTEYLKEVIAHNSITTIHFVPSMLDVFLYDLEEEDCWNLQRVLCSGEALKTTQVTHFYEKLGSSVDLYNLYGPTEAAIDVTFFKLSTNVLSSNVIPIGVPISNTQAYILDKGYSLLPKGGIGELSVGGIQASRGYLNRPDLTIEKFISNPFEKGNRLYKTGDLARWNVNGNLEFVGRLDNQVKIRGYRIELGEIESILNQLSEVKQGVVMAKGNEQVHKRLIGYVIAEDVFDKKLIQKSLHQKLPDYMIPEIWVELNVMPLTNNGKVDRKGLPDPDLGFLENKEYVAPRNTIEEKLVMIWQDVLGLDQVSVYDNFFSLGGHSLLATRVISMIRKELELKVSVKDLFEYPMISKLSTHLGALSPGLLVPRLKRQDRPADIPLSFAQERLWFIDKLQGSVQYHQPVVLRLQGRLDKDILESSFIGLVGRHELLRTVIKEEDGVGYQYIEDEASWSMDYIGNYEFTGEEHLQLYLEELISIPYELSEESILRVHLIRLSAEEHILLVMTHHIGSDGWSVSVMIDEFVELYNALEAGREISLAALPIQYADYSLWQRDYLSGELLEDKLKYWEDILGGVAPLELSTDYVRPAIQSTQGASRGIELEGSLLSDLQVLCRDHDVTMFMLLLSVFKVLLYRYSGQVDICVGSPIAGRTQKELEGLIGFFINTLALRSRFNGDIVFTDLLEEVKQTTLGAYEHQDVPFEKIVDHLGVERDMSRSALFQVMFVLQNTPESKEGLSMGDITIAEEGSSNTTSLFDLTLSVTEHSEGLSIGVEYCTALFMESTIAGILIHYKELLLSVIQAPGVRVGDLDMLTNEERYELLEVFNDTAVEYPRDKSVVDLFEEQVEACPDAVALVYEDSILTYQELNKRSNQLGHYLIEEGVRENSLVGICMDQSLDFVIGVLAVFKTRGAYIPIDFESHDFVIENTLKNLDVKIVVTNTANISSFSNSVVQFVNLEDEYLSSYNCKQLKILSDQNSIAYCMQTSGTTGFPKCVLISHRGVMDYIHGLFSISSIESNTSFALMSTITADLGYTILFTSLSIGGKLHLFNKSTLQDSNYLHYYFSLHSIDCFKVVPSYWLALENEGLYLLPMRKIIFGGDVLSKDMINLIRQQSNTLEIINHYGPTETTIGKLLYQLDEDSYSRHTIPIGKPFSNTKVYIVNANNKLCPVGVPGELLIGGDGVALGYLNQPELTAKKFIKTTLFDKDETQSLYRTGDIVRMDSNGIIDFIGRVDSQVKIRGYRIELQAIESIVGQMEEIQQGVVMVKRNKRQKKKLVGYVVLKKGIFDQEVIKNYLATKLPKYMIPDIWFNLEKIPLSNTGKIDKNQLPNPEIKNLTITEYQKPKTKEEQDFAKLWTDLLNVENIGVNDNFFEQGGDSIISIQLVSRARRLGYNIRPKDIFLYPSIDKLIKNLKSGADIYSEQGILIGEFNLLPIQQQFFERGYHNLSHYNHDVLLNLDKNSTQIDLQKAIKAIITYHDVLRIKFYKRENSWKQCYTSNFGDLIVEDLRQVPEEHLSIEITKKCHSYQQSLDIEKGVLYKFVWIKTPGNEPFNRLFIAIHHLVVDGVSWRILLDDLEKYLRALKSNSKIEIELKGTSYRQWQERLLKYSQFPQVKNQLSYWTEVIKGVQSIPIDYNLELSENIQDFESINVELNELQTKSLLQEIHQAYNTEINDILLCALAISIKENFNISQVVIGLESHGREDLFQDVDISNTIGWFTNLYPVLMNMDNNLSIGEKIISVKEQLRKIKDKGLGFSALRYLNPLKRFKEKLFVKEPFEIIFNYLGQFDNTFSFDGTLVEAEESTGLSSSKKNMTKQKISIVSQVENNVFQITFSFLSNFFRKTTIEKLSVLFIESLELIIEHCKEQEYQNTSLETSLDKELSEDFLDDKKNLDQKDTNILKF